MLLSDGQHRTTGKRYADRRDQQVLRVAKMSIAGFPSARGDMLLDMLKIRQIKSCKRVRHDLQYPIPRAPLLASHANRWSYPQFCNKQRQPHQTRLSW
jgi:hypothetical protein